MIVEGLVSCCLASIAPRGFSGEFQPSPSNSTGLPWLLPMAACLYNLLVLCTPFAGNNNSQARNKLKSAARGALGC